MKIELNGIPMDSEEEGGEGRSVTSISTQDARNTAAYDSPGGQSSSYSDLGRSAVKIALEGIASGKNGTTLMEGIWSCFKRGDPVEFNSDITGAADITKVLIDSMIVTTAAGNRNRYDYIIELLEYREPPEEPEGPLARETELSDEETETAETSEEAVKWADEVAEEAGARRNELSGVVVDAEGKPGKEVTVIITGCGREIGIKTDDQGSYKVKDLEPGEYRVSVDDPAYEGRTQYVSVGYGNKPTEESGAELNRSIR